MRRARIRAAVEGGLGVYHLISRTVNGEWFIDEPAKRAFRNIMWQVADFAGLEILTYVVLSNHFHILVRLPENLEVSDEELLRRYAVLYPNPTKHQQAKLEVMRKHLAENTPEGQAWRKRQLALMHDISPFMKLVKERFSIYYNARMKRFGSVWADRFKSTVVDPTGRSIETMAAYIDLNCVRAGIVRDPKDYPFCGYAEAVGGNERARAGIRAITGGEWVHAQAQYRLLVFTSGGAEREGKASIALADVLKVVEAGGKLPLPVILRCRIKYFSQAAVLGGTEFVERHVAAYRDRYKLTERVARQPLPDAADWGSLSGLRPLRANLLG